MSFLMGVFSGGDSLSVELKAKVDTFLKAHGAKVQIREGYGTTECVTASCLTPIGFARNGSIGIPFPDTYYKIVKVGTTEEVEAETEGEICLSGPTVMLGYLDNPEETANTLRRHTDGLAAHGRPGHNGRGRLRLLPSAHQADDHYLRLQCLSFAVGKHYRRPSEGAALLCHWREGRLQNAARQGVRRLKAGIYAF